MFLCQGGSQRGHSAVEAILVQGNGIHIALHQDQRAKLGLLRHIQGKQVLPLVKNLCFRGIQVFGRGIVHNPAAKADDVAPDIDDGEHEPVAEPVVKIPVFLGDRYQASSLQFLIRIALGPHGLTEAVPAVRSKADAEPGQRSLGHAPALGIAQTLRPGRGIQLADEESGGLLGQRPQPLLLPVAALVFLVVRHLHAHSLGQGADGVRVAQALDLHLEIDDPAALVAAEAIVDPLVRRYGKGRGLLPMEGAEAEQIGAGTLQVDILAHDLFNWVSGGKLIQKCRWKRHWRSPPLSL